MQHPIMVHTVYGPPRQHISQSMVHTEVTPTMTNSEDPDEVPHNAASHQGPHCLLSNKLKTIPGYIVHSEHLDKQLRKEKKIKCPHQGPYYLLSAKAKNKIYSQNIVHTGSVRNCPH